VYREAKRFSRLDGRGRYDAVLDVVNTRTAPANRRYRSPATGAPRAFTGTGAPSAEVTRRGLARYDLTVDGALPVVLVTVADTFSGRWDLKGLAATAAVRHIVDGAAAVPARAAG
jgi:hypothetical protein